MADLPLPFWMRPLTPEAAEVKHRCEECGRELTDTFVVFHWLRLCVGCGVEPAAKTRIDESFGGKDQ